MPGQDASRRGSDDSPDPPTAEELRRIEIEARDWTIKEGEKLLNHCRLKLEEETKELVPECAKCGGTDIRIKTSRHLIDPGNDTTGHEGRGPKYSTHVEFLYCEDCGTTYYKSSVTNLEDWMRKISELNVQLSWLRDPHKC